MIAAHDVVLGIDAGLGALAALLAAYEASHCRRLGCLVFRLVTVITCLYLGLVSGLMAVGLITHSVVGVSFVMPAVGLLMVIRCAYLIDEL